MGGYIANNNLLIMGMGHKVIIFTNRIRTFFTSVILCLFLSSCLYSEQAFFSPSESTLPFDGKLGFFVEKPRALFGKSGNFSIRADSVMLASPNNSSYLIQLKGNSSVDAYITPLPSYSNYYIAQFGPWDGGYKYYLFYLEESGWFSSRTFTEIFIDMKKVVQNADFSRTVHAHSPHFKIPDKDTLIKLYQFALDNEFYEEIERTTFDISDNDERSSFLTLVNRTESAEWISIDGTDRAKTPSEIANDNWNYNESVDVMTDKILPQISSKSTQYTGTSNAPIMSFSCGENKLPVVELLWTVPLEPIDRSANLKVSVVHTRFDKQDPIKLIWALSTNFDRSYEISDQIKGIVQMSLNVIGAVNPNLKNASASWTTDKLADVMSTSQKMIVRALGYSGKDITAIFDLRGFYLAYQKIKNRC